VGIREVAYEIWLVSFMDYDLGFFDEERGRQEQGPNTFETKVLPMSPVCTLLGLARPSGFEPETFPLGGGRSIQLS
jgi:hypothetical protein